MILLFLFITVQLLQLSAQSVFIESKQLPVQERQSLTNIDSTNLTQNFDPSCRIQLLGIDLAIVNCQNKAKYYHRDIDKFYKNQDGVNIDIKPQDDGYRSRSSFDPEKSLIVIGSKNQIKFLQDTRSSRQLKINDFTINQSVKIIDVDFDYSKTGRVFVAFTDGKNDFVERIDTTDNTRQQIEQFPLNFISCLAYSFSKVLVGLKSGNQILSYFFDQKSSQFKMEPIKTSICTHKLRSSARFIEIQCNDTNQVQILAHLDYTSLYTQKFKFKLKGTIKQISGQRPQYDKPSAAGSLNHIIGVMGVDGQFAVITGIQSKYFRHFIWSTDIYIKQGVIDFSVTLELNQFLGRLTTGLLIFTQTTSLKQLRCNRGYSILDNGPGQTKFCSPCTQQVSTQILQNCSQNCKGNNDPMVVAQCKPKICQFKNVPDCQSCQSYRKKFGTQFYSTTSTYSSNCEITSCKTAQNSPQCPSATSQAYTVGDGNPICIPYSGTDCQQCTANSNCKFYDNSLCTSESDFTNFEFPKPKLQICDPYICPAATINNFVTKIKNLPLKQNCKWKFAKAQEKVLKLTWDADGLSSMKIKVFDEAGAVINNLYFGLDSAEMEIKISKQNSVQVEVHKFTMATFLKEEREEQQSESEPEETTKVDDKGLPKIAIIGIAVGCSIFLVVFIIGIIIISRKKCRKRKIRPQHQHQSSMKGMKQSQRDIVVEGPAKE